MANFMSVTGISHDVDVGQMILDRTRHTIDTYGDYFETLLKFHRFYLSANSTPRRVEPPDVDDGGGDWRANIFTPYSFGTIETALPRIVFSLFGERPYVQMVGRERSDHERSKLVTGLLDYDMERSNVQYKSMLAFKSFLKYGITVGRVTYRREIFDEPYQAVKRTPIFDQFGIYQGDGPEEIVNTTRQVKRFDGPLFEPISVFNFFPDPLYYEMEDMRLRSHGAHRRGTTCGASCNLSSSLGPGPSHLLCHRAHVLASGPLRLLGLELHDLPRD